jgi:hypothetical protein
MAHGTNPLKLVFRYARSHAVFQRNTLAFTTALQKIQYGVQPARISAMTLSDLQICETLFPEMMGSR